MVDGTPQLGDIAGPVALVAANLFVVSFGMSWGPVVWVLLGESFPNRIRAAALSFAAGGQWVANWIITALIAGIIFFPLCFILIGLPLMFVLGVLCLVFPIVGGIKASNGEFWPYPMSFRFLPID